MMVAVTVVAVIAVVAVIVIVAISSWSLRTQSCKVGVGLMLELFATISDIHIQIRLEKC